MSHKQSGLTPYEAWTGRKPIIKYFKRFGCRSYFLDSRPSRGKLEPRGMSGIFLGYSEESKEYRIWLTNEKKIIITRDVKFIDDSKIS